MQARSTCFRITLSRLCSCKGCPVHLAFEQPLQTVSLFCGSGVASFVQVLQVVSLFLLDPGELFMTCALLMPNWLNWNHYKYNHITSI